MKNYVMLGFFVLTFSGSSSFAENLKLALNWKAEPQFGGFYAAQFNKHFKSKGLSVDVIEGGSGSPTIQMITAGKVDYAVVSGDEILISRDRNAKDVVAVFATFQTNPQGIMTHAENGFKNLEQVLKSEGTLLWQSGLPYAQYLTKHHGPFKIQTAPYLGGIGNFRKDKNISQQCFVTSEPLLAKKAGLKINTFLIADSGYNPYTTVLVTQASRLKAHPDEVKKIVQAVRAGWQDYLQNPLEINQRLREINKSMDLDEYKDSAEAQKALVETPQTENAGLGTMTEERWSQLSKQLFELKITKTQVPVKDIFVNLF